jgi:hypothetical protein
MWVGGQAGGPHTPTNMVRGLGLVPGPRFLNLDLEHGLMSGAKPVDLTGQRFGKLVVLSYEQIGTGKSKWICQCDCGNITKHFPANLKKGIAKSCGCANQDSRVKTGLSRRMDLQGAVKGFVEYLSEAPDRFTSGSGKRQRVLNVFCRACKKETTMSYKVFMATKTISCGCMSKELIRRSKQDDTNAICTCCKEIKPLEDFYVNAKGYRKPTCKTCHLKDTAERKKRKKEQS